MRLLRVLLFLSLLNASGFAVSQSSNETSQMPYGGAPCTGEGGLNVSAHQIAVFTHFDTELRSALRRNDPVALSFVVRFPLRVNTSDGTLTIPDASSLSGHYQEIFSPKVRNAILSTASEDYICRYDQGLAYKNGVTWASTDGHSFAMDVVNTLDTPQKSDKPKLAYTCETKKHRISIEELPTGAARYRSWNKPKSPSGPPDVEISDGKQTFEGTGVCAYPSYTFTVGNIVYEVQGGLGCTDGSEPAKATGRLSVTISGKQVTDAWCF
jgi:hypothetical protein